MSAVARETRIHEFLRKAELSLPPNIAKLATPKFVDFKAALPNHASEAQLLLVQSKANELGDKLLAKKLRNKISLISLSSRRLIEKGERTFSKYEVAKTFNSCLITRPLPPVGIAHGVLSHACGVSLNDLWSHFHDPRLEKRRESRPSQAAPSVAPKMTWLAEVTLLEELDYMHLMCQTGLAQETLNDALSIAIEKHLRDAIKILLSFGAVAHSRETIRKRVGVGDKALVQLLLSTPGAMSTKDWRYCMEPATESFPTILLLCLSQRPDVVCGSLLVKAIRSQNFSATATILAYAGSNNDFSDVRHFAYAYASNIANHQTRMEFFSILNDSGCVKDHLILRQELMKDVKHRLLGLVQILTDAGVTLDAEPNNVLHLAISTVDLEVLRLLKSGKFSSSISQALDMVPESTAEPDMMQMLEILSAQSLFGESVHKHLIRAVQKQHNSLVGLLIKLGASTEFRGAEAIRIAVDRADFDILEVLLRCECCPVILSGVISNAMGLLPRSKKLKAMHAILEKGVPPRALGVPLQTVVSEQGDPDIELIRLLLRYKAPIDGVGASASNSVLIATRRGELSVLKLLCDATPSIETLSRAVIISFDARDDCGYEVAVGAIKLLLMHGACGTPVDEALLSAAEQDQRLEIVRLLTEHGADPNYKAGAAILVALRKSDPRLLKLLCVACRFHQKTAEAVLSTATDPRYFNLPELELLLSCAPSCAASLDSVWDIHRFEDNPNVVAIVECFLRYGLNVDLQSGDLLSFAIEHENVPLLCKMLALKPSSTTLTTAFRATNNVQARAMRLYLMDLVLGQARSTEIGQSSSLLQQTRIALDGDLAGLRLLMRHNAEVDFDEGRAIQEAAAGGSVRILHLLFRSSPAASTLSRACLAAASSPLIGTRQKKLVFEELLAASGGALIGRKSKLLADCVESLPENTQLPIILLKRGAKPSYGTLQVAVRNSSRQLFNILASSVRSQYGFLMLFSYARAYARASEMDPGRLYWIYECLLEEEVPSEMTSEALLDSLSADGLSDLNIPKLLLQHGAAVDYEQGEAFQLAIRAGSVDAVRLLSQYIVNDRVASVAFEHARMSNTLDPPERLEIYRCLLQWTVPGLSIYEALEESLLSHRSDWQIVKLLLLKGADPNSHGGRCFSLACKDYKEADFRALSRYAKPDVVFEALLDRFQEESKVMQWFSACLQELAFTKKLENDTLLFACLRKFPSGTSLLKLLLNNGVSAAVTTMHSICEGWEPEPCTALIWALVSKPKISSESILTLLAQAGHTANPGYSTPVNRISAAFCCLLDQERTPVLKALLEVDGDNVLSYEIPEQSFCYLGAHPNTSEDSKLGITATSGLPLRIAAMLLGNFEAFRLLDNGHSPDDGILHNAALLALPKFVRHLLKTHSPDFKEPAFDQMIPLALVCHALPKPWCKIANEESNFQTRQKETMQLLAPRTDASWRYRGRTVLHFALDQGAETTAALIDALGTKQDPQRYTKYLYTDKDGKEYNPVDYVKDVLTVNYTEKANLGYCLLKGDLVEGRGLGP